MEKLRLTPRLRLIASLVSPGAVVADVGTDHGYVPVWLLQNGVARLAFATDINRGPLSRARQVAQDYGEQERMSLILCDGLRGVQPHAADTVVIAGMGGETIQGILEAAAWTKENTRLILQPQSKQPELRRWLRESGYRITGEFLVRDTGKIYNVLTAEGGAMPIPSTAALYAGELRLHHDKALLAEYLEMSRGKLMELADKLGQSARDDDKRRRDEYLEAAGGMSEMLKEMEES